MKIELRKFGEFLTSRPAGKDGYLAAKAYILPKNQDEEIIVDFEGVHVLAPSWADEFITKLQEDYPGKVRFVHTENASVKATLQTLEEFSKSQK